MYVCWCVCECNCILVYMHICILAYMHTHVFAVPTSSRRPPSRSWRSPPRSCWTRSATWTTPKDGRLKLRRELGESWSDERKKRGGERKRGGALNIKMN